MCCNCKERRKHCLSQTVLWRVFDFGFYFLISITSTIFSQLEDSFLPHLTWGGGARKASHLTTENIAGASSCCVSGPNPELEQETEPQLLPLNPCHSSSLRPVSPARRFCPLSPLPYSLPLVHAGRFNPHCEAQSTYCSLALYQQSAPHYCYRPELEPQSGPQVAAREEPSGAEQRWGGEGTEGQMWSRDLGGGRTQSSRVQKWRGGEKQREGHGNMVREPKAEGGRHNRG